MTRKMLDDTDRRTKVFPQKKIPAGGTGAMATMTDTGTVSRRQTDPGTG